MSFWIVFPEHDIHGAVVVPSLCLTLLPHGLQHGSLLSPPLSPGVCSNSCPLSQLSYSLPRLSSFAFNLFRHRVGVSIGLALHIRWPKYCSFSFTNSPFNEYSGLVSSRIDWFDIRITQREESVLSTIL